MVGSKARQAERTGKCRPGMGLWFLTRLPQDAGSCSGELRMPEVPGEPWGLWKQRKSGPQAVSTQNRAIWLPGSLPHSRGDHGGLSSSTPACDYVYALQSIPSRPYSPPILNKQWTLGFFKLIIFFKKNKQRQCNNRHPILRSWGQPRAPSSSTGPRAQKMNQLRVAHWNSYRLGPEGSQSRYIQI